MATLNNIVNHLDDVQVSSSFRCQPDQCTDYIKVSNTLNVLHLNIRSINKNFDELSCLLVTMNITGDAIVLSECWFEKSGNIPTLDGYSSHQTKNLINQNDGLVIYIRNNKATTLILETSITDHAAVLLNLEISKPKTKTTKFQTSSLNISKAVTDIINCDFSTVYKMTDANQATTELLNIISPVLSKNTIQKSIPSKQRIIKPWITIGLLRCIHNRDKMHNKTNKEPTNQILKLTYLRYRNFCNNILKKLKKEYEEKEFEKAKNNPKKMWELIRNVTDTKCIRSTSTELLTVENCPTKSVNTVNTFFANVGLNLTSNISPQNLHQAANNDQQSTANSMVVLETDEEEVKSIINNLRINSATGWDGIPTKLLIHASHILAPPITYICNLAISTGTFPNALKKAIVHPIYKSGDRDEVTNYRPISVLPAISKVLERIMYKRLNNFLDKYKIISQNQFGFRRGLSTEDAVTSLLDFVVDKVDNKFKCLGLFLDLSKAFDTVSVPLLLSKLENIGVRGTALTLFSNFLTDRLQCVQIGEHISDASSVVVGLPQGSLLSPLLFQVYVNELCQLSLPSTKIIAYADDTAILSYDRDWTSAKEIVERGLSEVMLWLGKNNLALNIRKTNFITFGLRPSSLPSDGSLSIKAHKCDNFSPLCSCPTVTRASVIRYLGIQLDSCLSWKPHLQAMSMRLRKLIFLFKKLRVSANSNILKIVYSALCESIINYCITAWGGAAKTDFIQVERAQRAVIKVSLNKPFRFPTRQLYEEYKTLTVRQHYILRTVLRKHATLPYASNNSPTARRRSKPPCPTTHTKTTFARRHFTYLSARIYNKLHQRLNIHSQNTHKCKKIVKTFLLTLNYDETETLVKPSSI